MSAQQPTQDWRASSQGQTTIQPAAQDWNTPVQEQTSVTAAQDWNTQPQQSVPSAPEWGTPGQENVVQQNMQDWNQQVVWDMTQQVQPQQQQPQQQWSDQQQAVPYGGPQQWGGQQQAPSSLAALFDFSFKGSVLKNDIDIIYLVTAICSTVFTLFELIAGVSASSQYNVLATLRSLFVPLALAFAGIILSRAFLEGMAALVEKNDNKQK